VPELKIQVKFTIDAGTVSAFKNRCSREGVSMASEIRRFMDGGHPIKDALARTDTRPERRKAVAGIIGALTRIMEMEAAYRDNIPEMFEGRYEAADHACEQLAEAVTCLEDAF
jgi:hypothetical protein